MTKIMYVNFETVEQFFKISQNGLIINFFIFSDAPLHPFTGIWMRHYIPLKNLDVPKFDKNYNC